MKLPTSRVFVIALAVVGCGGGHAPATTTTPREALVATDADASAPIAPLAIAPSPRRVDIVPGGGHVDSVTQVAFSPSGKLVATGSDDSTIKVWDSETGALGFTLAGHTRGVRALVFVGEQRLASGSADGTLRIWDLAARKEERVIRAHQGGVNAIAISSDGTRALTGGSDRPGENVAKSHHAVALWDLANGTQLRSMGDFHGSLRTIAWSRDGRRALAASYWHGDETQLFDVDTGALIRRLAAKEMTNDVACVLFTPDESHALVAHWGGNVRIYDLSTGRGVRHIDGDSLVNRIALTPSGDRYVAMNQSTVQLWDVKRGAIERTMKGHEHNVLSAAISPDGKRAITGSIDRSARIWDLASGAQLRVLEGLVSFDWSVAYAPDGLSAATAGGRWDEGARAYVGTEIHAVSLETGAPLFTLSSPGEHETPVRAMAFTPDGKRLVTSHQTSGDVRLWDVATQKLIASGSMRQPAKAVRVLPDGSAALLMEEQERVDVVALEGMKSKRTIETGRVENRTMAISPDGSHLATGHSSGVVQMFETSTGRPLPALVLAEDQDRPRAQRLGALAFSPDGKLLAAGDDDCSTCKLHVLDTTTGATIAEWSVPARGIASLTFTADGRTLVSGGRDSRVVAWDPRSGKELGAGAPHKGDVIALLAIGPDVLSAGKDTALRVWRLP